MLDETSPADMLRLFRSIFARSRDAVVILEPDGRLVAANDAARALDVDVAALVGAKDESLAAFRARLAEEGRAEAEVCHVAPPRVPRRLLLDGSVHDGTWVVVVRDVTVARQEEEELRRLRRADSVGFLTASVVHDFNNILTPIVCASAMLSNELGEGTTAAALAGDIRTAAERAAGLVRQVLAFVRRESAAPEVVDLNSVVLELRGLLQRVVGAEVELSLDLAKGLGWALVDREQLEQVILNLAANAHDAMPRGGRLTIKTANVDLDAPREGEAEGARGFVVLTVADTGVGMTAEVRERVFDRFFTTKAIGHGTGLGLPSALRFATRSGGIISVHSEPGRGTTLALRLPRARAVEAVAASAPAPSREGRPARAQGKVLLVEDDEPVRRVVRTVLVEAGYDVVDTGCPRNALAEARRGAFDLVLADVVLPGMSGPELVEVLLGSGRCSRALLMSGHTDAAIAARGAPGGHPLVRKAFSPDELLGRVRTALEPDAAALPRASATSAGGGERLCSAGGARARLAV